ncbi:MAG: nucleoside phosphorylase [Thermodesulfobacteriota bacterium]
MSQGKFPKEKVIKAVDFLKTKRAEPLFSCSSDSFPDDQDVLIHPVREPGEEAIAPTVILTFTQPDYRDLCRLAQVQAHPRQLWGCAYRPGTWEGASLTIVAPALGAPFAAMILEKLIVLGARRVLVLGWCGSVASGVRIGDLILPTRALPGDGTSPHYCQEDAEIVPHQGLYDLLATRLEGGEVPWHTGPIWSTDAFYRETRGLIRSCQAQGVLGMDLELAALFAVGRLRGIAAAALLLVSDELFTCTWKAGRGSEPFRRARQTALRLILDAAPAAEEHHV